MAVAKIDDNTRNALVAVSNADGSTIVPLYADPTTHRLLVDFASSGGTVTSVSVVTANGFAGSVANATTTPAITLTTSITGILQGNGTAISAATTTGSGSVVLATSPTLVTPLLGTPTSGVLTNCTGYTVANLSGLGTGVATALAINTGSAGAVVLFNGALGTPSSGTLTNCTGYATGSLTGLGTGVATALAINVGSAGAFVTFNGALGTPSSGTVTNLTGTASININGTVGATTPAAGTFTAAIANSFVPNLSTVPTNGLYLPAANTLGWAVNSAAEMQLTSTALSPAADGGSSLGTTSLGWQNLFANTGFVFNIENSDWVATHTAGILTVGTGDLRVSTAGTNSASVVTVGGTQTLTNKTLTSPTLTTPSAFTTGGTITLAENTSIALDPAGSADGKYTGITVTGTGGATISFGQLVYLDAATSRWKLTDADASATAGPVMIAMAVTSSTDGNPITVLLNGIIRADAQFPTLTIGAPAYVGETAGAIQVAIPTGADNIIRVVGFALTADEIYFNPSQDHQVTVA